MTSDPRKNPRNRWWWLPGTISAIVSSARLAYEFIRDHFHLHGK
ncbi:hypothetical protein ACQEVF_17730 [Nonomuraea polychroma]